jgi:hypothetical protein
MVCLSQIVASHSRKKGWLSASSARSVNAAVPTAEVSGSNSWAEDVMDFVAREHENVREHLGHMVAIADAGPGEIPLTLRNRLDAVFRFLHTDLLTLMAFEEQTLYPALDRIPDVPSTPGAMTADHDTIRRAIGVLDDRAGAGGWERWSGELHRPLLVDIQARIRRHLGIEEFLYGPLLSRLDPAEYIRLHQRLAAIRSARGRRSAVPDTSEASAKGATDDLSSG